MKFISRFLKGGSLILAVLVVFAFSGALLWDHMALKDFTESYILYASLASKNQNDAFIPAAAANPLRQELNDALGQSLAKETSAANRLRIAQHGLDLIHAINKQVDQITESEAPIGAAIDVFKLSAQNPGNLRNRGTMMELVTLAQEQLVIIGDIRGYSYRANFETQQIFNRLITEKGELTDAYVNELNAMLPNVEEQFSKRESLYIKLEENTYRMQKKFDILTDAV